MMVVMTAVCDLEQDFRVRFSLEGSSAPHKREGVLDSDPHLLTHVLLCDAFEEGQIRQQITGTDIWKRVRQNQDERYHHLSSGPLRDMSGDNLADLYMDFKKATTIPTELLYDGLSMHKVQRLAVVLPVYVHDLMHRFYSFLSRVGVPTS